MKPSQQQLHDCMSLHDVRCHLLHLWNCKMLNSETLWRHSFLGVSRTRTLLVREHLISLRKKTRCTELSLKQKERETVAYQRLLSDVVSPPTSKLALRSCSSPNLYIIAHTTKIRFMHSQNMTKCLRQITKWTLTKISLHRSRQWPTFLLFLKLELPRWQLRLSFRLSGSRLLLLHFL